MYISVKKSCDHSSAKAIASENYEELLEYLGKLSVKSLPDYIIHVEDGSAKIQHVSYYDGNIIVS